MKKILILLGVCNLLNIFDAGATHYSLTELAGEEINPAMRYIIFHWGWLCFYAFKIIVMFFVSWALISLAKKNKVYATRTAYILVGMYAFVSVSHLVNFFLVFFVFTP